MAITETTHPYEFLVRWNEDTGEYQAYHFKTITKVWKDAKCIAATENIMNVAQAEAAGFQIEDIMTAVQESALKTLDEVSAERDVLKTIVSAMESAASGD